MYGGSSKLGRGGAAARGGGGAKRSHSSFPLPSRRSSGPSGGRLSRGGSAGGPHNRTSGTAGGGGSSAPTCAEETFSLIPGKKPPAFAMIIRLTPDLVEEIRRAESQGETPRIKFDANAKNANGNVIDVGGKEFRFIWSRERDDLCDIYEERQSGEDGNGLLVESGSAWRKLNVQRVLDESTTNHVKMRSEEAERKLKARKAICLDPANPSTKSQMKALAAVETNPWKKFKQKKEPPLKKQKVELPQGGQPKPAYKSGLASTTVAKSRLSASPLPSPHEQFGAPVSPFGPIKTAKSHLNVEEIMPSQVTNKETAASLEKEIPSKAAGAAHKGNFGAKPKDLQSLLITLLKENPKGMSLKALVIAVGDPNSTKKIEPVIKRIATFQAPGRYFLKPGMDENFWKPSSNCGSSPDENRHPTPAPEADQKPTPEDKCDQTPARESSFDGKVPAAGLEERAELNKVGDELNSSEPIHIQQQSPNLVGERRISDTSDGPAGSSSSGSGSGSDSDSESDSGDSESGSHRRSRSPSPAGSGSGSGSSSDSESDVSSNSKEGSDEDVDIMTSDDDNEPKNKLQASELPNSWGSPDGIAVQNGLDEKQDDLVEIEKDSHGDGPDAERPSVPSSIPHEDSKKHMEETKQISPDRNESQNCQNIIENVFEDEDNTVEERISKGKSRGGSDSNHFDNKSKHAKRLNAENLSQPPVFGGRDARFSESPRSLSPGGISEFGLLKGCNQATPVKSRSDFHQLGQRSSDQSTRASHNTMERFDTHAEILGRGGKYSDKANEDGYVNERKGPSNLKEGSGGGKYLVPSDAHYQKPNDVAGKFKVYGQVSNSRIGLSPNNNRSGVDRSPIANVRGSILQRELSDLELGELREAVPVEPPPKKQFERKSPFKQLENKFNASENMNLDSSRGKSFGKSTLDSVKPSPPNLNSGVRGNLDSLNRKKTPEHVQSQEQNVSRGPGSYPTKDSQRQTNNTALEMTDGQRDAALTEGNNINSDRKRWSSYSDENAFSYSKYDKDKPELKGPIKDFAQYKEYVQEYRDKYDSYCTLNKILESDRIEFLKLGKDLELAKDRDMGRYRTILGQLMESYQQCGEKHKRLKKIFIVLHEELKHLKQKITDFALPYTRD